VVPKNIAELVGNPGGMRVMMTMTKLEIAALEAAAKES
jgi:predicted 3-demethylubiquinone-9 3-methyltransferase (glyoxalase superfamily)